MKEEEVYKGFNEYLSNKGEEDIFLEQLDKSSKRREKGLMCVYNRLLDAGMTE